MEISATMEFFLRRQLEALPITEDLDPYVEKLIAPDGAQQTVKDNLAHLKRGVTYTSIQTLQDAVLYAVDIRGKEKKRLRKWTLGWILHSNKRCLQLGAGSWSHMPIHFIFRTGEFSWRACDFSTIDVSVLYPGGKVPTRDELIDELKKSWQGEENNQGGKDV